MQIENLFIADANPDTTFIESAQNKGINTIVSRTCLDTIAQLEKVFKLPNVVILLGQSFPDDPDAFKKITQKIDYLPLYDSDNPTIISVSNRVQQLDDDYSFDYSNGLNDLFVRLIRIKENDKERTKVKHSFSRIPIGDVLKVNW